MTALYDEAGAFVMARSTLTDITQRKAAEVELQRANAELARAARLKDEFLATMSHELRSPLSAILGRVELLAEGLYGPVASEQSEALRGIEASGRHLLTLINEILDLAKIEAGKLQLECDVVWIEDLCQQSLYLITERAQRKQLAVHLERDPAVTTMLADERRLRQILINLLTNAVKFTPEGGSVGLEVRGDPVQQQVSLAVWDTGIGIAEADLPRLFQPFTQVDSGLSRQQGGTGLGLTLVRRLAEAHGGVVGVTSVVGEGTRFTVTLPWITSSEGCADTSACSTQWLLPHSQNPVSTPAPRAGAGCPILLVEDHAEQARVFADALRAGGYQVHLAQDGAAGLALARSHAPALVLMDIQMPGMDGLDAIRRMRADAQLRSLPIIALTAMALPGDRERCLEAGATAYLTKPVHLQILMATIADLLAPG
jgi:CheY-like chemotaxis protein/nitrogen-specific signal transduction histidine kinase